MIAKVTADITWNEMPDEFEKVKTEDLEGLIKTELEASEVKVTSREPGEKHD